MNKFIKEELQKFLELALEALHKNGKNVKEGKKFLREIKSNAIIMNELKTALSNKQKELSETYFIETLRYVSSEEEELIKKKLPNALNNDIIFITNPDILGGFIAYKGSYILNMSYKKTLQTLKN